MTKEVFIEKLRNAVVSFAPDMQTPWTSPSEITGAFAELIGHFGDSILAISYRNDGIPSISWLVDILETSGRRVTVFESDSMRYVLSNKTTKEVLLVAE